METVRFGDEIIEIAKSKIGCGRYENIYANPKVELPWVEEFMGDPRYDYGVGTAWCFYFAAAC